MEIDNSNILLLNNIEVVFSSVILVLKGISLEVGKQKIVALLGNNGAGKTTTLKAISGLIKTEEGEITRGNIQFNNVRIDKMVPEDIVMAGIVPVLEGRRLFRYLTVEENLRIAAYPYKEPRSVVKQRLDVVYEYFPQLKNLSIYQSGYLSGGEAQMMVIGRALMARPKVMLLDEPSLGLAPSLTQQILKIIVSINSKEKCSVLLVEQNANAALSIADYGYVLENGKVVLDGSAEALKKNEDVREFYLGLGKAGRKLYKDVKHYKRRKRWLK